MFSVLRVRDLGVTCCQKFRVGERRCEEHWGGDTYCATWSMVELSRQKEPGRGLDDPMDKESGDQ